jgi:acyl carrier protein
MKLEEEFDVSVDESELENITTVGEAYELVMSKR